MLSYKSPTISNLLKNTRKITWCCHVNHYASSSRDSGRVNHYDVLGITPKSTHKEVKAAYYKLSKAHHPDLNAGSEEAAIKFKQVTAAYEVLGSQRLRRLYDKGLCTSTSAHSTTTYDYNPDPTTEDFKESNFYKSRHQRSKVPTTGRTQHYDFDTWSKHHYGTMFERRTQARARWQEVHEFRSSQGGGGQRELFFFIAAFTFVALTVATRYFTGDYDKPKKTVS